TRDVAWALTMSEIDDMDFYREKPNPQNSNEIYFNGRWVKLEHRIEKIAVKGGKEISIDVQTGPHGPLVQNLISGSERDLISVKWQNQEHGNRQLETFFDLMHYKTLEDSPAALKKAKTPGLNISYIDKAGNIGWWVMGQIPIRPPHAHPDLVLDGASGK